MDLWDAARKAPVSPPAPTSPTGFDISPPPGMSPDQQLFDMGQDRGGERNGKPVDNLLQEMAGRGWKINTPVKAAAPAPPPSTAPSLLTKIPYSGIEGAPTGEESPINPLDLAKAGGRSAAELALFPARATAELGAASAGRAFSMEGATGAATTPTGITDPALHEKISKSVNDAIESGKGFVFGAPTEATAAFEEGLGIPFEALGYVPQKVGAYVTEKTGDPLLGKGAEYATLVGTFKAAHRGGKVIQEGIDRLVRSKKPITVETAPVMAPEPPAPFLGAPITSEVIPTPPRAPEATVAPETAPGTPLKNDFMAGPAEGTRYRVSEAQGGVLFEKRSEMGTPSTFYIGPDGILKPAEEVSLIGGSEGKVWYPKSPEARTEAKGILDQMGRLDLKDPNRKALVAKLKEVVAKDGLPAEAPQPAAEAGPVAVPEPAIPVPEPTPAPAPTTITPAPPISFADEAQIRRVIKKIREGEGEQPPADLVNLPKEIPPPEPPVQTPGEKFANVRDIKSKQKKTAAEPTLQQRILRAGGIKIDPAMRGEFAQYGLRQGEGALARLYRSEKHPGYKKAMGWDQWVETLIEDGTLPKGAGISDLFEAIKKNKRPGTEIADEKFAEDFAKSQEKAARETVPENEIALGDSFRIDGEKFKAVKYDEQGRLVIKDGVEHRLGPGDSIRVDGGKEGIIPSEIPKAAEEAPVATKIQELEAEMERIRNSIPGVKTEAERKKINDQVAKLIDEREGLLKQQDLIKDKSFKLSEEPVPEEPSFGEFRPEAAGATVEDYIGKIRNVEKKRYASDYDKGETEGKENDLSVITASRPDEYRSTGWPEGRTLQARHGRLLTAEALLKSEAAR